MYETRTYLWNESLKSGINKTNKWICSTFLNDEKFTPANISTFTVLGSFTYHSVGLNAAISLVDSLSIPFRITHLKLTEWYKNSYNLHILSCITLHEACLPPGNARCGVNVGRLADAGMFQIYWMINFCSVAIRKISLVWGSLFIQSAKSVINRE